MIYTLAFPDLHDKADDLLNTTPMRRQGARPAVPDRAVPRAGKAAGATIRSREISACLVLQTRSQLKAIYKDNADTIVGNMDSQIFLGGSEPPL